MKSRLALASVFLLMALSPLAAQFGGPVAKKFPFNAQWIAVSLNGKSFGTQDRPAMTLDEQLRVRGFSGCNTYSATAYPLAEQHFAVGPIALTKRACEASAMEAEREFLVALRTAQQWDVKEGRLIITGQSGVLIFERTL
jgi:heat shock protein HslJ